MENTIQENPDKDDPKFNSMDLEKFRNIDYCRRKGDENLYRFAMSNFRQQNIAAIRPVPTLCYSISIFVIIAIVGLAFGIPTLILSADVVEIKERYDNKVVDSSGIITFDITIEKKMENPIYVYYELHNFYQNHRMYAKSVSWDQLRGDDYDTDDCDPVETIADIKNRANGESGYSINDDFANTDDAYPCGLIAKRFFNDNFSIANMNNDEIYLDETNIAWKDDEDIYKIGKIDKQWQSVTEEKFKVWMRIAGLPTFRKKYGKIYQTLNEGEKITVTIKNNFYVKAFDGEKYIVLSTTNAFGGKNYALGGCLVGSAGLSIILCIIFLIGYCHNQSKDTAVVMSN